MRLIFIRGKLRASNSDVGTQSLWRVKATTSRVNTACCWHDDQKCHEEMGQGVHFTQRLIKMAEFIKITAFLSVTPICIIF